MIGLRHNLSRRAVRRYGPESNAKEHQGIAPRSPRRRDPRKRAGGKNKREAVREYRGNLVRTLPIETAGESRPGSV
jgi:hypothetical protein